MHGMANKQTLRTNKTHTYNLAHHMCRQHTRTHKLGLCLGWKGLGIRSVTRGREGEGRGGEGRGGEGDLIKMKTHTLDKTFSFHDIKNILEFLDKSSRVMHKNISKQIINKQ